MSQFKVGDVVILKSDIGYSSATRFNIISKPNDKYADLLAVVQSKDGETKRFELVSVPLECLAVIS